MTALVRYEAACRAVAEAKSVDEVKDIRDRAIAMAAYARQAKNREMVDDATEIRMRAERRLGELIKAQKETVGLNAGTAGRGRPKIGGAAEEPPNDTRPTLSDAGIDKKLSSRAQQLATLSNEQFEKAITHGRTAASRAVKTAIDHALAEIQRQAYDHRTEGGATVADLQGLAASDQRFAVIYADPPWSFNVYSGKGKQRSAERHYDTDSLDDIKALPVEALAADDCALFLWAVMPELPGALDVLEAWGFTYKTVAFTWVKQNRGGHGLFTGMGYWTRANAEVCLLGTKGSPSRLAMDVAQVIMEPVSEHSRKPDETRVRIQRLLAGPYLELYGRQPVANWTVWGNEVAPLEAAE